MGSGRAAIGWLVLLRISLYRGNEALPCPVPAALSGRHVRLNALSKKERVALLHVIH